MGRWRSSTGTSRAAPSRRFAAGIIALRPDRDGHISGYDGVDDIQHRFGEWIIDSHLPPPGTPTQPVEAGYMANAWVRMKHPDYDVLRECSTTSDEPSRSTPRDRPSNRPPSCGSACRRRSRQSTSSSVVDCGEPFPIVDREACTFAHHGEIIGVRLVHFGVGLTDDLDFEQLGDSDWWVLPLAVPPGSRIEYKLEVVDSFGTHLIPDPLNRNQAANPFGVNSVCAR